MPNYFVGIFAAFLEPVLHAWSNIIDNHFSNNVFPRLAVLLFFGTILNILFLPIVFLTGGFPSFIPSSLLPFVFLIGLINVVYLFPYYWALRHTDTSIVGALFAFGRIFVPLLAFFFLGEVLAPMQYLGFFIIILSATLLSLDLKTFKLNRAFFLMLLVTFMLAVQAITYKFVFDQGVSWSSVATALVGVEIVIAGIIMFTTTRIKAIVEDVKKIRKNIKLFALQQGVEWGGYAGSSFAISIIPVTVAQAIVSTQPIFILLFASFFSHKFSPEFFKEATHSKEFFRKGMLFLLLIIGTILVVTTGTVIDI